MGGFEEVSLVVGAEGAAEADIFGDLVIGKGKGGDVLLEMKYAWK